MHRHKRLLQLTTLLLSACCWQGCSERFSHTVQQVPPPADAVSATVTHHYSDSTITLPAGPHYTRSRLHTFFYGKHYRSAWNTPVEVKVLDISTAKGGLTPKQKGGSRQTINLRLEDSTGREYVLRSIDKDPAGALSDKWQKSYAANIIRDATSATHPYAALTLPHMAQAVGIYHTTPELVFVPHDPNLGEYRDDIGGMLALLERRPAGDQSDNPLMGHAKKVKNTRTMLENRLFDNNTKVDARLFLRARLFDMLIGDWSRHEDNWRWAEFEEEKGYTYQGIPRDRDNVFYKLNDAIIPWLFMRTGVKSHFQTFRSNLNNVVKLNKSGRNLDEIILAELDYQAWTEIADSVRLALTDEVIEEAFKAMPPEVYPDTAPKIISKLKARRNDLSETVRQYYKEVADIAHVVGTDKHELFEVEILSRDEVQVRMFKTAKDGEVKTLLFDRKYHAKDTKELQLYGLNGNDQFIIKGTVKPRMKISVWGGAGADTYTVTAGKSKAGKRITLHDSKYRNTYEVDKHTQIKVDDAPPATVFDANGWLLRYYLD